MENEKIVIDDGFKILIDGEIEELELIEVEKESIDDFYKRQLKNEIIHIDQARFDNERFKNLILTNPNIKDIWLKIDENMISEENIKILRDKSLTCYLNSKKISSPYVFGFVKRDDLSKSAVKILSFKEEYLEDLKYLPNGSDIYINDYDDIDRNLNLYVEIINRLESLGINATLEINETIISNTKFKESKIPYCDFKYTTLKIFRDGNYYTLEEYLEEDKKLENLVSDVKNSNLSPFEKYLAVYNVVKQFKKYKENKSDYVNYLVENGMEEEEALQFIGDSNNEAFYDKWVSETISQGNYESRDKSRKLKYILDNEYIVCVGFAKLLIALLERVGIKASDLGVNIDTSYSQGFTLEEKPIHYGGHARVLINLNDPKYEIDGYYVADPTWDNDMELDLYNHAVMTIEETSYEKHMQKLEDLDYLLDVHNMEEFNTKVNALIDKKYSKYLLDKKDAKPTVRTNTKYDDIIHKYSKDATNPADLNNPYIQNLKEQEMVLKEVLNEILRTMMKLFRNLDYKKYKDFSGKFKILINNSIQRNETKDYYEAFTDFGNYILTKTNKKISGDTILKAASVVRSFDEQFQGKTLEEISEEIRTVQIPNQEHSFPRREIDSDNLGIIVENEINKFEGRSK